MPRVFLTVPRHTVRGVGGHFYLEYHSVVLSERRVKKTYWRINTAIVPYLDVAFVRVLDIVPKHVVGETPVVLFAAVKEAS